MLKTGLLRNTIDKFYTNISIVNYCCDLIKKYLLINKYEDLIIEPSAGNGAFIDEIKQICNNYIFYDIEPEHNEIIKLNYLDYDYLNILNKYNKIHIIGNPPFGRQSSMAYKFIKKSAEFVDSISFILPKSFIKNSWKDRIPDYFHLICEYDIPCDSFNYNSKNYNIPCIFQIWTKKNVKRIKSLKQQPLNFIFVNKNDNPDISFRRVGVNAGFIDKNYINKNIQSHYFIKFNKNIDINDITFFTKIKNIQYNFNTNNTVGPKSISKNELICELNKIMIL
jgi:hypothetical protein